MRIRLHPLTVGRYPLWITIIITAAITSLWSYDGSATDARKQSVQLVPVPQETRGVSEAVISLNGIWQISTKPAVEFWRPGNRETTWASIEVPGEAAMQGFVIEQGKEFAYRLRIDIPKDYRGRRILIRFDGVYSDARVWVNGVFVGQHVGGFTSWDVDVTDHVDAGEPAHLVVGVIDQPDDISRASFYAKHNIGGILRDVHLIALPSTHLTALHLDTDLDSAHRNAVLRVRASVSRDGATGAQVRLALRDPEGQLVDGDSAIIDMGDSQADGEVEIPLSAPMLWDAEHPNLYTLEATLFSDGGAALQKFVKRVGIREVEIVGDQMLVNGSPVTLRGVNRHSIHPRLGRADSREFELADAQLFRSANVNFIRTSHYPPTESFLRLADEYGFYIEEEAPITWWNDIADISAYTDRFLTQVTEMIERDRDHASVIFWSIGNESFWDDNFQQAYELAKRMDRTRPVMWSYAPPAGPTPGKYDIFSEHYPQWDAQLPQRSMPVLLDEFAHVSSYNFPMLQRDPGIRDYWGKSIDKFSHRLFSEDHLLGGAIWGGVDEVFFTPDAALGYGQWGIVDVWRRQKPEYWHVRKAYSPIYIPNKRIELPSADETPTLLVHNRFDHTNLSELKVTWSAGGKSGVLGSPDVPPRTSGQFVLPAGDWADDERLRVAFRRGDGLLVDEVELVFGEARLSTVTPAGFRPARILTDDAIVLHGEDFEILFDTSSGRVRSASVKGEQVLSGGPELVIAPYDLQAWALQDISSELMEDHVRVDITGHYDEIAVRFELRVYGDGVIDTTYSVEGMPTAQEEVGIRYALSPAVDRLSWSRNAEWSIYPDDHIGRANGIAYRYPAAGEQVYREQPAGAWSADTKDYFLFSPSDPGRAPRDFRSAKRNIINASAWLQDSTINVSVVSDGSHSVRMGTTVVDCRVDDKDPRILYTGSWEAFEDGANCAGTEKFSNDIGAAAEFRFFGDAVKWIGPTHYNLGMANILIDGEIVERDVNLFSRSKINQRVLFSRTGLSRGWHSIRVEVAGKKSDRASDSYIVIDGFHYSDSRDASSETDLTVLNELAYKLNWGNFSDTADSAGMYSNDVRIRLSSDSN